MADFHRPDAIAIFFNSLGGAVSISIAQNIFSNTLIQEIPKLTTGVNPAQIIAAGATHVREVTPKSQLPGVLEAYDLAIRRAFILPIAVGGIALIWSFFVSDARLLEQTSDVSLTGCAGGMEKCQGQEFDGCWWRLTAGWSLKRRLRSLRAHTLHGVSPPSHSI